MIHETLLDLLFALDQISYSMTPMHVLSAFRTVETDTQLLSSGIKQNLLSYHTVGQAVDVYIPGQSPHRLARLARDFQVGGVGIYPNRHFIHLDTGPVRTW